MPQRLDFETATLSAAVSMAASWSDLYARLGFDGRPGPHTQRRVKRLIADAQIDTGHFHIQRGPRRTWTADELAVAIAECSSWSEVEKRLRSAYRTVRQVANEQGFDVAHLDARNHMAEPAAAANSASLSLARLRDAAEHVAVAWYTLHGYEVYIPALRNSVDLLAFDGDRYLRVQVKTGTGLNSSSAHWVHFAHRSNGSIRNNQPYEEGEVDEFFALTAAGEMFRIPFEAVAGRLSANLGQKYKKYLVSLI